MHFKALGFDADVGFVSVAPLAFSTRRDLALGIAPFVVSIVVALFE